MVSVLMCPNETDSILLYFDVSVWLLKDVRSIIRFFQVKSVVCLECLIGDLQTSQDVSCLLHPLTVTSLNGSGVSMN